VLWLPDTKDQGVASEIVDSPAVQTNDSDALNGEIKDLRRQLAEGQSGDDEIPLGDEKILQNIGIYRYHHPLENAVGFKDRLTELDFVRILSGPSPEDALVCDELEGFV
jgi:hypothetical protein